MKEWVSGEKSGAKAFAYWIGGETLKFRTKLRSTWLDSDGMLEQAMIAEITLNIAGTLDKFII